MLETSQVWKRCRRRSGAVASSSSEGVLANRPVLAELAPMLRRIGVFFREALWRDDLERATGWRAVSFSVLRVIVHASRSFAQNMGSIRAAGLSLITLLAIVPLLALITALGGAFGYGDWLKEAIRQYGEAN